MLNEVGRFSLARHPFYQSWMAGALTQDDLRDYAIEYYPHVAAFPDYLRKFSNRLTVGPLKMRVYQNLCEELGLTEPKGRPHAHLWLIFAEHMGADSEAIKTAKPSSPTRQLISLFESLAETGTEGEALAAFYVYESQVASLAADKATALRDVYRASEAACEYFDLHSSADVRHANIWHEQLERAIHNDPYEARRVIGAAIAAARSLWEVMDWLDARRGLRAEQCWSVSQP